MRLGVGGDTGRAGAGKPGERLGSGWGGGGASGSAWAGEEEGGSCTRVVAALLLLHAARGWFAELPGARMGPASCTTRARNATGAAAAAATAITTTVISRRGSGRDPPTLCLETATAPRPPAPAVGALCGLCASLSPPSGPSSAAGRLLAELRLGTGAGWVRKGGLGGAGSERDVPGGGRGAGPVHAFP